ncbi:MAG TPA: TetR/AcrR family transcriptional regulator [Pyrinomonadaceae bacterium]|nr:TetR/AcrR family transcriptional regulator [Pyrinomonadaceae bacterium]
MTKQISILDSSSAPASGGRMAGDERRLQILRVAVSLFAHEGFRGTTTKKIAQAAGVSEAMVFRHYATKEELYTAILDHKACSGDAMDPEMMVADALKRKDDRAVFEGLAFGALEHHESDPEFQRLLMHSALEGHELAQMFFEKFVRRVYEFLGAYIRERQQDGAIIKIDPAIVVRAFIGMIIHHSLNNNLWDPQRRLLNLSNESAAKTFTDILLGGISSKPEVKIPRKASKSEANGSPVKR